MTGTRKVASLLGLATLAALGLAAPMAHAQSIGVNFIGGGGPSPAVSVTDPNGAGADVKTLYWNNEAGLTGTDVLNDSANNATAAALTYTSQSTYSTFYLANTPNTGDYQLMSGYLDERGQGTTVTVTQVPYSKYNVYVYMESDVSGSRTGQYTVNGVTKNDTTGGQSGNMATPFNGTFYNGETNTYGNYLEFTNVTGDLTLTATAGFRAPLAGFQIVAAAPEPSQCAGLALGVLGLGALTLKARKRQAVN